MKRTSKILSSLCLFLTGISYQASAQQSKKEEADRVKMEHAQIGIVEDKKTGYKHTENPGAQWYPQAGFGLFVHWSIASVKEIDLSWPMMAGTQIGWRGANNRMDSAEVKKIMDSGDFFTGHHCKVDNSCITPNQYWAMAKDFNPQNYDADKWIKAAKDAGMTYAVLTTRHHDGFAMWPSKYGDFNTKNYMGGRDLVKDFVAACRKYGLKVGLYYSGPDWHFNREFQNFMYYGVGKNYANIPELDADLHVRTTPKTDAEKQAHYKDVAAYIKGQIEELLTNYGKIDMIWFDGSADIPKGNSAWNECISMDRIHQLQPGIVVSPRFYGYGDYKTFEGDKALPTTKQDGWAELCATIANSGWGYTKAPLKSASYVLSQLINCRANNTNLLLNFGPTKDGVFINEMYNRFNDIAAWMKINAASVTGVHALDSTETASVPATAGIGHRYLFILPPSKQQAQQNTLQSGKDETITFKTNQNIKNIQLLSNAKKLNYTIQNGVVTIVIPAGLKTELAEVIDIQI
ncbi:alpha-L-fucosidase [Chitinophagaceae bacterium LWZ2-11]